MRKNLLLTSLLMLIATLGIAQTAQWPIVLTTADGLPGERIVRNYSYQSKVFELDEAVSTLRFTVYSTNTVDSLSEGSYDGMSAGWGPGFPFFTMGEFRLFDGNGKKVEYVASSNAVSSNDGGGLAALSDNNEGTYLHTTYSFGDMPQAYHYIELEFDEPLKSFSFNWSTRPDYHKNLITYMGITPGTEFFPFPNQQFQMGEKVTKVEDLAEEGALYVIRGNSPDYHHVSGDNLDRWYTGASFYHSPYGAAITPSAASIVYLTADPTMENGYKIHWLNNNHSVIAADYNQNGSVKGQLHWTNNDLKAGSFEFALAADSAEMEGDFYIFANERNYIVKQNPRCRMEFTDYTTGKKGDYYWSIYKASINGAAIAQELQAAIDEAQSRIDAIGGEVENDEGEYEELVEAMEEAKAIVANPEVTAAEIITKKRELNLLTAAYAAVGIWAYVDSIDVIVEAVENEELLVVDPEDGVNGAYDQTAYNNLSKVSDEVLIVIDNYQSIADIDAAIAKIYAAIDNFWGSKKTNVKSLPMRIGNAQDGLPGIKQSNGSFRWESPVYNLTQEVDSLRITVFKTNNGATYKDASGTATEYNFPTFAEIEFYDAAGNKIPLGEANFKSNSVHPTDGKGIVGLCDGSYDTHYHAVWQSGKDDAYDAAPDHVYIEIVFPEPISTFKYVQYGRKNSVNTPIDFVIGEGGIEYDPEDIEMVDPYKTTLGEQITDASQITDDGFYAIVGLINCAPEGDGTGYAKFYSSNTIIGKELTPAGIFSIRKTGADGTYYIQSLADGKYWSSEIDNDGWGQGTITMNEAVAGKFHIAATPREEYGKQAFPNTFVIYQYNDTVKRNDVAHPYIVVQDWGDKTGYFSIPTLGDNDWDGEGEWYIYKATMDNPYCYWLNSLLATANGMNMRVSNDPGFYSQASAGKFAEALAKAQAISAANDNAAAKTAIPELQAAISAAVSAEKNPMSEGTYVIESAYTEYFNKQNEHKVICIYYNDFEATGPTSEYSLYWAKAPADYKNAHDRYKFQFISAKESESVQVWLEDSIITPEQAANAYYIQCLDNKQYIGSSIDDSNSKDIGMTDEPEVVYIVRPQGDYKFDIWNPVSSTASLHTESHSSGSGQGGDIVYYNGTSDQSKWTLRLVSEFNSINNNVAEEGDEVVSTTYYTVGGVAISAPVQGMNIVKKTYANGVVKTEKVYIK